VLRLLALLAFLIIAGPVPAAQGPDLYSAKILVTGTGEPERTRGLRDGLAEVVVKLTGDARLSGDRRLEGVLHDPHRWVERFDYEDRLKGIPIHDEQGSRERPYFLHMRFDPVRLDPELQRVGRPKWEDRPAIKVLLGIRTKVGTYVLGQSGPQGYGERTALLGAAERRGLVVTLPESAAASVSFEDIAAGNLHAFERGTDPKSALLSGTLTIAESGYWDIAWRLSYRGRARSWSEAGVTFDVAFLNGLDKAALLLGAKLPF
jgi:hypothetical protein